jgi:hypothetical protein
MAVGSHQNLVDHSSTHVGQAKVVASGERHTVSSHLPLASEFIGEEFVVDAEEVRATLDA